MTKQLKTLAAAVVLAVALGGCAIGREDVSREDWKVREYQGISKRDAIDAAREVIRLADPDDIIFQVNADGFTAERRQLSYFVVESGVDIFRFEFSVREKSDGSLAARFDIWENIERANLLSLGLPIAKQGKPQSRYAYDLFYARMEYLLGLEENWRSCAQAGASTGDQAENLGIAAFCGRFSSDIRPPSRLK